MITGLLGSILAFIILGAAMEGLRDLYCNLTGMIFLIVGLIILFFGSGRIAKTKKQNDCLFCLSIIIIIAPFFLKLANRTEPLPEMDLFRFILIFIAFCIFTICICYLYCNWWESNWEEHQRERRNKLR